MSATIKVEKQAEGSYRVTIKEGGEESSHRVGVASDYARQLTGGRVAVEELLRRSFEFLLEHEPKESILSEFDLPVIGRYFPDYEQEIRKRLAG